MTDTQAKPDIADRYQMKFGRYKGKALSEIPVSWLTWIIVQYRVGAILKERIVEHLKRRIPGLQAVVCESCGGCNLYRSVHPKPAKCEQCGKAFP